MNKLVHVFYTRLLRECNNKDQIKRIYSSLYCRKVMKNGGRCTTATPGGEEYCPRHARPQCMYLLRTGARCSVSASIETYCKRHHELAVKARAKGIVTPKVSQEAIAAMIRPSPPMPKTPKGCVSVIVEDQDVELDDDTSEEESLAPPCELVEPESPIVVETMCYTAKEVTLAHQEVVECAPVEIRAVTQVVEHGPNEPSFTARAEENQTPEERAEEAAAVDLTVAVVAPVPAPAVREKTPINKRVYARNYITLEGDFLPIPKKPRGCQVKMCSGPRAGQICGKTANGVLSNGQTCKKHDGFPVDSRQIDLFEYMPKVEWKRGDFWDNLRENYSWPALAAEVKTEGSEVGTGAAPNDDEFKDDLPSFIHLTCGYCSEDNMLTIDTMRSCEAPIERGEGFCREHRKSKIWMKQKTLPSVHDTISLVCPAIPSKFGGWYHFFELNLFARLTRRGLIVVGKLWPGSQGEQLATCNLDKNLSYARLPAGTSAVDYMGGHIPADGEEAARLSKRLTMDHNMTEQETSTALIRRCHNNGLLYKCLSQEYLMKPFDTTNIDALPGEGFVSFEQMIAQRPTLYIKYWKIWNRHIERAREALRYEYMTPLEFYEETGGVEGIAWFKVKDPEGYKYGLYNLIIPPPELARVKDPAFNPFKYCEEWVLENAPDKRMYPHFPPMYVLYPFPEDVYQEVWKADRAVDLEYANKRYRNLLMTYKETIWMDTPYQWLQWVKYGEYRNVPSTEPFGIPPLLQKRLEK